MKAKYMANGDVQVRMTREQFNAIRELAKMLNDEENIVDTFAYKGLVDHFVKGWVYGKQNIALLELATSTAEL